MVRGRNREAAVANAELQEMPVCCTVHSIWSMFKHLSSAAVEGVNQVN